MFAWYRHANFSSLGMTTLEPGVVLAFTIGTPARPHFARVVHHWGDEYIGWSPDFYMGPVHLLATHVRANRFRALVAPITARLARGGTTNCTAT